MKDNALHIEDDERDTPLLSAMNLVRVAGLNPYRKNEHVSADKHADIIANTVTSLLLQERTQPKEDVELYRPFLGHVVRIALSVAGDRNNDYELRVSILDSLRRLYDQSTFYKDFEDSLYMSANSIYDENGVDELRTAALACMEKISFRNPSPNSGSKFEIN